jgi:flagellum-specific peptidoglycan hydrolase FlgJ
MTADEFIEWLAPSAQAQTRCYNLPASVLIAQGAIESGWGQSVIGQYNLFGRKWNGVGPYIELPTQEYEGGRYVTIRAKFQDYPSLLHACDDWCILMTQEPCYAPAVAALPNLTQFVRIMGAKYATDPDYANKVLATIRANNLTRFDA